MFGGSASAVAILAAWSLLHVRLGGEGLSVRQVIQRNTMDDLLPILGDFTARSSLQDPAAWAGFTRMLSRKGKARIAVAATLHADGETVAALLTGEFVGLVL